ncbi:hypothetical protein WKH56_08770 [Priestia sp. SB1]|uniref:Uncharacterized protein n=1 Tax=Priestia aryabhattai TaxID=412384 RepID=A0AAX6NE01_PRIAR|nr:hypothetical protein [Priestia aryabhattai]MDU9693966.1 hypothetical protein [Priestia aryabhattai]NGY88736.1 hypothetical protein [Priestia megaterium]
MHNGREENRQKRYPVELNSIPLNLNEYGLRYLFLLDKQLADLYLTFKELMTEDIAEEEKVIIDNLASGMELTIRQQSNILIGSRNIQSMNVYPRNGDKKPSFVYYILDDNDCKQYVELFKNLYSDLNDNHKVIVSNFIRQLLKTSPKSK